MSFIPCSVSVLMLMLLWWLLWLWWLWWLWWLLLWWLRWWLWWWLWLRRGMNTRVIVQTRARLQTN